MTSGTMSRLSMTYLTLSVKPDAGLKMLPLTRPQTLALSSPGMGRGAATTLTAVALAVAAAGCGSSDKSASSTSHKSPTSIQDTQSPAVDVRDLLTGSPQQQITATIVTFYKATWEDDRALACEMFSPAGETGFMQSAKVAFPYTVNSHFTCPEVMSYYNATLADAVDNLQQAGVNISGNILEDVGVKDIVVHGNTATAQAPENVEEFIKPKLFVLQRLNDRWQIEGTKALGKTLPQLLAQAKAKGELRAKKK